MTNESVHPHEPSDDEVSLAIDSIPKWRHRIVIGSHTTPGTEDTDAELRRLNLETDFSGLRVLDIGCSDGHFSFEVERRGASEVVAIDDESSLLAGGVNGFTVAHDLLGSKVKYDIQDVERLDPDSLGTFDRVLFINVLYHLRNPLLALDRIASVVRPGGTLVLKTYFQRDLRFWFRGRPYGIDIDRRPKWWFFPTTELGGDPTNWFAPNKPALAAALRATGWTDLERIAEAGDRIYYHARRARGPG